MMKEGSNEEFVIRQFAANQDTFKFISPRFNQTLFHCAAVEGRKKLLDYLIAHQQVFDSGKSIHFMVFIIKFQTILTSLKTTAAFL